MRYLHGKRAFAFLLLFLGVALFPSLLPAQVTASTGAIQGLVTDPSGKVVTHAEVKLTNHSLRLEKTATSNSEGTYVFPVLPPASGYEVTIETSGFSRYTATNLSVRVTENTVLNIKLQVGSVTEQVTVSGGAQQVNTTNATLGEVVGTRVITALPLPSRNVFDLAATDAGVYENFDSPASTIAQGGNAVYVAGQRATANDYKLNGIESTSVEFHTLSAGSIPIPSPDAVQEFRTQTSLYDATSAYGSGGSINLVTRSGTSNYHGTVYDFFRNTVLNANDYFLKAQQLIKNQKNTPPVMLQNQFGGSFGGPVPLLHKTFFFVNYEGTRQKNGSTGLSTGNLPVLPATRDAASLAAAFGVPVGAIDPVALKLINAPGPLGRPLLPSGTGTLGTYGSYAASGAVILNTNQVSSRLDHDFTIAGHDNHLAVAYFYNDGIFINPSGLGGSPGQAYDYPLANKNLSIIDTHTFSSKLVNEAVYGFNWEKRDIEAYGRGVELSDVGMTRFNSSYYNLLPAFSFSDTSLGVFGYGGNIGRRQHTAAINFRDTASLDLNKNTLRFGFESIWEQFNESPQTNAGGTIQFQPYFADILYGKPTNTKQDTAFRDFLIGAPYQTTGTSGEQNYHIRATDLGAFLQDDYRFTRRLTLNLGVRYDHLGNPTETHNFLANFDPSLLSTATLESGGAGLQQGFLLAGKNGVSATTLGENNGNFSPRVGFAYDVFGNGKLAVHGGFGLYYQSADDEQSQLVNNIPFNQNATQSNYQVGTVTGIGGTNTGTVTGLGNPTPTLPLPSAFPIFPTFKTQIGVTASGAPQYLTDPGTGLVAGISPSVYSVQRNNRMPYSENFNLTAQYAFARDWTLAVGYLETNGVRQSAGQNPNNALFINATSPGRFGLTTNTSANRESRVPIAGILSTSYATLINEAFSSYNALLVTVTHQLSRGFLIKTAYTHSKSIDNFPAGNSNGPGTFGGGSVGNQFLLGLNKGTSEQDVPNRLVVTYVWDLPGFRSHHVLDAALGHWSLSGITTYQDGLPGTVIQTIGSTSLTGTSGYGLVTGALRQPGSPQSNYNASTGAIQYLNFAAATVQPLLANTTIGSTTPQGTPGSGTYPIGASGGRMIGKPEIGVFRAPFQNRWDATLSKNFPVKSFGEGGNVEFRAEAFKLWNNTIFNAPNSTAGATTFGQITSTVDSTGRQLQFAVKVSF
ncbi:MULTISPECIES: TonB-dependent receptor [Acidobacteriaceae]|uniref:carboxypeptidase regulatory-like domain-containing protein n=1 Tax=Acidobacteriaceae TaxID=204434 RepID=UPI00131C70FF|nr:MULTISPECIES: TonB-dependent receptor [Acidobacteriaceae]MDW5266062.1 TonB-dependent receptor [Edaphobacter sp.]